MNRRQNRIMRGIATIGTISKAAVHNFRQPELWSNREKRYSCKQAILLRSIKSYQIHNSVPAGMPKFPAWQRGLDIRSFQYINEDFVRDVRDLSHKSLKKCSKRDLRHVTLFRSTDNTTLALGRTYGLRKRPWREGHCSHSNDK
jgi:hypothetical protein